MHKISRGKEEWKLQQKNHKQISKTEKSEALNWENSKNLKKKTAKKDKISIQIY